VEDAEGAFLRGSLKANDEAAGREAEERREVMADIAELNEALSWLAKRQGRITFTAALDRIDRPEPPAPMIAVQVANTTEAKGVQECYATARIDAGKVVDALLAAVREVQEQAAKKNRYKQRSELLGAPAAASVPAIPEEGNIISSAPGEFILAGWCSKCGGQVHIVCTSEQAKTSQAQADFFDHRSTSECFRSQMKESPNSTRKPTRYDIRPNAPDAGPSQAKPDRTDDE
jgi:hypothetical protein